MNLSQILSEELNKRKLENAKYSLRMLALDLDINRTTLCFVINNKRNLSRALTLKLIEKLAIPASVSQELLKKNSRKDLDYKVIDIETFAHISNWYHQGIICLANLKKNQADPNWIAQRLNILPREAADALDRLITCGLVEIRGKKMVRTFNNLSTPTDVPSEILRNYHRKNLELISRSLQEDRLERRDITSMTFHVDEKDMLKMKEKIKRFQRTLCKTFENKNGSEVYTLATHLFPLTQEQKS